MKTGTNLKAFHFGWILGIFSSASSTSLAAGGWYAVDVIAAAAAAVMGYWIYVLFFTPR